MVGVPGWGRRCVPPGLAVARYPFLGNLHGLRLWGWALEAWWLVDVARRPHRVRQDLEECKARGSPSLGARSGEGQGLSGAIPAPLPLPAFMGPVRQLFNAHLGGYLKFIGPVNGIHHSGINHSGINLERGRE